MATRPRLTRNIPFWALIAGSLASAAAGAYVLLDKLGGMDARLTDGTATSNDVYVGQIWGVFGAVLIGAGLVGLALALTVASLKAFAPHPATEAEIVEAPAFADDEVEAPVATTTPAATADDAHDDAPESTDTNGYGVDLGYSRPREDSPAR